jgi:hypothetical protein
MGMSYVRPYVSAPKLCNILLRNVVLESLRWELSTKFFNNIYNFSKARNLLEAQMKVCNRTQNKLQIAQYYNIVMHKNIEIILHCIYFIKRRTQQRISEFQNAVHAVCTCAVCELITVQSFVTDSWYSCYNWTLKVSFFFMALKA